MATVYCIGSTIDSIAYNKTQLRIFIKLNVLNTRMHCGRTRKRVRDAKAALLSKIKWPLSVQISRRHHHRSLLRLD